MSWVEFRLSNWIGGTSGEGFDPLLEGPALEEELGPLEAERAGS